MFQKPQSLIDIDKSIGKKREEYSDLEARLLDLDDKLPDLVFENDTKTLTKVEGQISEIKKQMEHIDLYLAGAAKKRRKELDKWIAAECQKLDAEADSIEKEAKQLEEKTTKLIAELNKIQSMRIEPLDWMGFKTKFSYQVMFERAAATRSRKTDIAREISQL